MAKISLFSYNANTDGRVEGGDYSKVYANFSFAGRFPLLKKFIAQERSDVMMIFELRDLAPKMMQSFFEEKLSMQVLDFPYNKSKRAFHFLLAYNSHTLQLIEQKYYPLTLNGQFNDPDQMNGQQLQENALGAPFERASFVIKFQEKATGKEFFISGMHPDVAKQVRLNQTKMIGEVLQQEWQQDQSPAFLIGDGNFIPGFGGEEQEQILEDLGYVDYTPSEATFFAYPYDGGPLRLGELEYSTFKELENRGQYAYCRNLLHDAYFGKRFDQDPYSVTLDRIFILDDFNHPAKVSVNILRGAEDPRTIDGSNYQENPLYPSDHFALKALINLDI